MAAAAGTAVRLRGVLYGAFLLVLFPAFCEAAAAGLGVAEYLRGHGGRRLLQETERDEKSWRWVSNMQELLKQGDAVVVEDHKKEELIRHIWRMRWVWPSLAQPSAAIQMCAGTGGSGSLVQGMVLLNGKQARLTVLEAELLHNIDPEGYKELESAPSTINLLAFLESAGSIRQSQWHGWGVALMEEAVQKMSLTCRIYGGHDPAARSDGPPLYETKAAIVFPMDLSSSYYFNIRCPLEGEEEFFKLPDFQVELVLRDSPNSVLHLEPVPICRETAVRPFAVPRKRRLHIRDEEGLQPLPALSYGSGPADQEVGLNVKTSASSEGSSDSTLAICIRAYHEHGLFSAGQGTHSREKLWEFLDYHLLIGVSRFYFYDRYGTDMQKVLQPYIDRGVIILVPFPTWSEVFYRKELYYNNSITPYDFPAAYDQVINYEHCLMQGRRNNDTWMAFLDTDEFMQYSSQTAGRLPAVFDEIAERHAQKNRGQVPVEISMQRFNFLGANGTSELVLDRCTSRCESPIPQLYFRGGEIDPWRKPGLKNKIALQPKLALGEQVWIHQTAGVLPSRMKATPDPEVLRVNHYRSTPQNMYMTEKEGRWNTPCTKRHNPTKPDYNFVEDTSLLWAAKQLEICLQPQACRKFSNAVCGNLCTKLHREVESH